MAEITQHDMIQKMTSKLALEKWRHGQADMEKHDSKLREEHELKPRYTNSQRIWGKVRLVQEFLV